MLALMQWGGRTHFLLAILRQIPEVLSCIKHTGPLSDRYRMLVPSGTCLLFRYTAFIILYPIGIAPGESEFENYKSKYD
ncbi:hypothetical protein B296_00012651 [Ensete ventricosum]|uniref:Very-long-chain (3R)-3-hydroxyacyl-CoA dehydratase n=1 Tax=Ensete ventricosum TaxID=4639 RepID=A0A427B8Z3_ENSVE|nr:hypothetical protein B296_00012651 [Ensete ventricosum]